MFQPQPTPFSAFYSDFIPGPIDDLGNGGLSVREREGPYAHPQQHTSFSSFQQAHFGAAGASGGVDPGPGPSVGSSGPSGGPGLVSGPGGLGNGGAVATPAGVSSRASVSTAPLSTFPLHGALPHPQQLTPAGAPSLFDHESSTATHDLHRLQRSNPLAFRNSSASSRDMEQNSTLSDDLAAQEAAARNWQPELQVLLARYLDSVLQTPFHIS